MIVLLNLALPSKVDIPVALKLRVTMSAPKTDVAPPPIILIPLTNKLLPSNVKLALSSSSPPVPARTTLPDVKSSTLNVFA